MHTEILNELEGFIEEQLHLLKSVKDSWQPSDILPDMSDEDWHEKVEELRAKTSGLSDELLVVLIGNTVTEEALPSYQTWLNRFEGMSDKTGISSNPWSLWTRAWTAEENRHGELLNKYLYLSGRVNMNAVEITTQNLIRNGFDVRSGDSFYKALVYAAFQERGTKISHRNVGLLAEKCGETTLSKMCVLIAGDEARHEEAYKRFFGKILELAPCAALYAFADMMKQKVIMPARLMSDETDRDLFNQFSVVAQKIGVYTIHDYVEIIDHLINFWGIPTLSTSSPESAQAQEYLCNLPGRYTGKIERLEESLAKQPSKSFRWIFDRCA